MSTAPLPTSPPDGRKAGATWVAATGAFLLLASATVFIAVRWDQLPEEAKMALLGALTGGFLAGGRALRRSLPATGEVLFHLGALLLPINVAALGLRLDLGWRPLLLLEGLVGVAVLGALGIAVRSVVLTTTAAASVAVLAAGIAAVSPLPAPLVLAAAAVVAHLLGRSRSAITWAGVAGLAPVLGAVAVALLRLLDDGTSAVLAGIGRDWPVVLEELGLGGRPAALLAVLSGGIAAVVLGREAARRHDLALVALAGTCLSTGAATTWVNAEPSADAWFLAGPALFVVLQAAAMLCQRDPFWSRPARAVALAGEVTAGLLATPAAAVLLLMAPFVDEGFDLFRDGPGWVPEPVAAVAWGLLAGGWLLAAWRRQPPQRSPLAALSAAVGDDRTVAFLATAVGAAAVVGSASTIAIGATFVVLAAGLAASRGTFATLLAATAAVSAPLLIGPRHPLAALLVGLAAAAVLGLAARAWKGAAGGWIASNLAGIGSLVALCSCAIARDELGLAPAMLLAVGSAWALAVLVERASPLAGHVVRATMVLGVAAALSGSPLDALVVAAAATALFVLDSLRHDEPLVALGASLCVQVVAVAGALQADLDLAVTGVVLCATALVYAGLAAPLSPRWRLPFAAAAGIALLAGLSLSAADGARFAEALILVGGITVGAGLILRSGLVAHAGGAAIVVGVGLHLMVDGVTDLEPFVAPVALQLLVAGWQLRSRAAAPPAVGTRPDLADPSPLGDRPSSWLAYGPAIGLLGGAALVERLSGGPAWHGLVAGAVGVTAVAAGGWRRLAGPLFLGTGLVVAVTVLESLAALAGVPTWAWLAAGGTLLLATGVALERTATSPVEAGRRLVDVVDQRFT